MNMKEDYQNKLQAELDEWNTVIDELKAKADKAGADVQLEYHKQIKELRSMQETANNKLTELNEASGDVWEDMKAGVHSARDSLGNALKSATTKFK